MAEMTITFRPSIDTGRLEIRVEFQSDEDTLPQEHEDQHRRLVARLLPSIGSDVCPGAVAELQRERPAQEPVVG
jgi:hypothetical protein